MHAIGCIHGPPWGLISQQTIRVLFYLMYTTKIYTCVYTCRSFLPAQLVIMLVKMLLVVSLSLLWSLVEVHPQTEYPYVSFMGEILPNNSYVDLTLVGTNPTNSTLQCISDLDGSYRGDWYFPDEERVQTYEYEGIYASYENQSIYLQHNNIYYAQSGIYQCVIEVAGDDEAAVNKTVYVGLYRSYYYEGKFICV